MANPNAFVALPGNSSSRTPGRTSFIVLSTPNVRVNNGATYSKCTGVFCSDRGMSEATIAPINEQTIQAPGKLTRKINEGSSLEFTVDLNAGAIGVLRALVNTTVTQSPTHITYDLSSDKFWVSVVSWAEDGSMKCRTYQGLDVTFETSGGLQSGEDSISTVKFRCEDDTNDKMLQLANNTIFTMEHWYDDGASIVNAAAPDGAITTFTLGDGNGSYTSGTPTPVALNMDDTQSVGARKYLRVWLNGVEQTSGFSFNSGTSVITFTTAPDANAKLTVGYVCSINTGSIYAPLWDSTTQKEQIQYAWENFA